MHCFVCRDVRNPPAPTGLSKRSTDDVYNDEDTGADPDRSPVREREERFKWSEVRRGIFNVQVWLSATAYFAILSGLYSFGLFVSNRHNSSRFAF